jgi:hypothetical protein|tara:strand:- start:261 stop:485 length:225 start_codon:yes stop_codon:yes gene_type:complete
MITNAVMIDEKICSIAYLSEAIEKGLNRKRPLKRGALDVMENQIMWKFGAHTSDWPKDEALVDFLVTHYKGRFT